MDNYGKTARVQLHQAGGWYVFFVNTARSNKYFKTGHHCKITTGYSIPSRFINKVGDGLQKRIAMAVNAVSKQWGYPEIIRNSKKKIFNSFHFS